MLLTILEKMADYQSLDWLLSLGMDLLYSTRLIILMNLIVHIGSVTVKYDLVMKLFLGVAQEC